MIVVGVRDTIAAAMRAAGDDARARVRAALRDVDPAAIDAVVRQITSMTPAERSAWLARCRGARS